MKKILSTLLFFNCLCFLCAQNSINKCGTTNYINYLEEINPGIKAQIDATFETAKIYATNKTTQKSINSAPDSIFRIPVVFHVVYNTPTQNIHDSLIQNQIEVLNEDFRRLNADTSNTRTIFKSRASDTGIEFFLATIDPNGNPTSGITRTSTTVESFNTGFFDMNEMDEVKKTATGGVNGWDTDKYLNIWVCNLANPFLGESLLGYAYPPVNAPNWPANYPIPNDATVWGLNMHYKVVGRYNPNATGLLADANKGRSTIHEIGHFLGLRHIWGDSGDQFTGTPDCDITLDDGFDDTPHMGNNSQQTGCSFTKNTCTNAENPDEPDMIENYMDYSPDACRNMFTQQQTDLMRSMLVVGRPEIAHFLENDTFNLVIGTWIVVNEDTFQVDASSTITINQGDSIIFLNENNGITYISENNIIFNVGDEAYVSDKAKIINSTVSGISSSRQVVDKIYLFPNPAENKVNFSNLQELNITKITLLDISGKILKEVDVSSDKANIDIENLSNGIYFVAFKENNIHVGVKKLNKIK